MGISTIAIDTGADKKKLCDELGATAWIDFRESKDIIEAIKAATPDGLGPHAAIVTSPRQEGYDEAMAYIRPNGVVVAVGLPREGAVLRADVFWTVIECKTLTGSYVGNRLDAIEALRIAADGHVKCPFKLQPFSALDQIFGEMEAGNVTGRIVLDLFA